MLQVFSNQGFNVRGGLINSEPYFVAKDVCEILGYANTSKAISDHVDDEDRYNEKLERGGSQICINESGLYSLILRSNKSNAKAFKKWVTSEVLPTIRKTGKYEAKPMSIHDQISLIAQGHQNIDERVTALEQSKRLERWQEKEIKHAVDIKVHKLIELHNMQTPKSKVYSRCWKVIKDRFQVASYSSIAYKDYETALEFTRSITIDMFL